MTILTKPVSEKKSDKLIVPLVDDDANEKLAKEDVEAQPAVPSTSGIRMIIIPGRLRRVSKTTTFCLLLTALMVVGVGIVGGSYLYQQYIRSQLRIRGWCSLPLNGSVKSALYISADIDDGDDEYDPNQLKLHDFLHEQFELDLEKGSYEKIDVPDFRDGRSGRFIHDFNTNMTGIVDLTGGRCFVMPLNRGDVLPPRSLYDLINKMWDGYYTVNTELVRETMHVSTPALTRDELKNAGLYIEKECERVPVYKLEKYEGGVVKRSAEFGGSGKFVQFAGTYVTEIDIPNLGDAKGSPEVKAAV